MSNLEKLIQEELQGINIDNPEFDKATKVHDWRSHVPYEIWGDWDMLTIRERQLVAIMANNQAMNEEWD